MTTTDYGARAREWWAGLDTGERAALRHCRTPVDALMLPQTYDLLRRLGWRGERVERVAALACVLAHVRVDENRRVARAIGRPTFGDADGALIAEVRFRRLVSLRDPAELQTALTRTVAQMGNRANVADLTTSMLFWNDTIRAAWAADYYAAAIAGEPTENANV